MTTDARSGKDQTDQDKAGGESEAIKPPDIRFFKEQAIKDTAEITRLTTALRDAEERARKAETDVAHAVSCAKKRQPDYPWTLNTASEAVWACGEAHDGVSAAFTELESRLAKSEERVGEAVEVLRGIAMYGPPDGLPESAHDSGDKCGLMARRFLSTLAPAPPASREKADDRLTCVRCGEPGLILGSANPQARIDGWVCPNCYGKLSKEPHPMRRFWCWLFGCQCPCGWINHGPTQSPEVRPAPPVSASPGPAESKSSTAPASAAVAGEAGGEELMFWCPDAPESNTDPEEMADNLEPGNTFRMWCAKKMPDQLFTVTEDGYRDATPEEVAAHEAAEKASRERHREQAKKLPRPPPHPQRRGRKGMTCPHKDFHANVAVNRLEDSGRFQADVTINCAECGVAMRFVGLPAGLDLNGATTSADGTEGRFAIAPKGEVLAATDGAPMGFTVRKDPHP